MDRHNNAPATKVETLSNAEIHSSVRPSVCLSHMVAIEHQQETPSLKSNQTVSLIDVAETSLRPKDLRH